MKKIRALMYIWLVRKWLKRSAHHVEHGPFPNVAGRGGIFLGLGTRSRDDEHHPHHPHSEEPGAGVEVRFEWKRGKVRGSGRGRAGKERKRRSIATTGDWDNPEDREDGNTERERSRDSRKRKSEDRRLSSVSGKSNRSLGSGGGDIGSEDGGEKTRRRSLRRPKSAGIPEGFGGDDLGDGRDVGEESDPEDSETPWVCTMKVRRTGPASSSAGNGSLKQSPKGGGEKEVLKLKVGTLSPTPHHPKVVAMLKVPFPLPDVEVERLSIRRRGSGSIPPHGDVNELGEVKQPISTARDFARGTNEGGQDDEYRGLELSAEEVKDIVCSTAMWLVVREGTGGVGRVSRKGDGWKLRS
jgi:hypothetical protein